MSDNIQTREAHVHTVEDGRTVVALTLTGEEIRRLGFDVTDLETVEYEVHEDELVFIRGEPLHDE